jgi:hypothetical protein
MGRYICRSACSISETTEKVTMKVGISGSTLKLSYQINFGLINPIKFLLHRKLIIQKEIILHTKHEISLRSTTILCFVCETFVYTMNLTKYKGK